MSAAILLQEELYEVVLVELADLDDDAEVDIREILPRPWEVPASVATRMSMGELRRRIRAVRSGL